MGERHESDVGCRNLFQCVCYHDLFILLKTPPETTGEHLIVIFAYYIINFIALWPLCEFNLEYESHGFMQVSSPSYILSRHT